MVRSGIRGGGPALVSSLIATSQRRSLGRGRSPTRTLEPDGEPPCQSRSTVRLSFYDYQRCHHLRGRSPTLVWTVTSRSPAQHLVEQHGSVLRVNDPVVSLSRHGDDCTHRAHARPSHRHCSAPERLATPIGQGPHDLHHHSEAEPIQP